MADACDAGVTRERTNRGITRAVPSNSILQDPLRKHSDAIQGYAGEFILSVHNPLVLGSNPCGPTNEIRPTFDYVVASCACEDLAKQRGGLRHSGNLHNGRCEDPFV